MSKLEKAARFALAELQEFDAGYDDHEDCVFCPIIRRLQEALAERMEE